VLLVLDSAADPAVDREPQVRAALGGPVAATVQRVLTVPADGVVMGPTGKVRKFLMRQAMLAQPSPIA
jgi:hypothetical protein